MKIKNVFCLFEQSGTFKDEFLKLGIHAEDYDIMNDFGKTDYIIDLFAEIEKAYNKEKSLFDKVGKNDLVFAFFPCTRFEARIPLGFRGEMYQMKNWSDERKLKYAIELHQLLDKFYILICKLFIISIRQGFRMIVENPYKQPHYLTMYFPIKPTIIDKDRSLNGDYYKKPTQYWFVNCKPEQNIIFETIEYIERYTISHANNMKGEFNRTVKRSLIHPQYAKRFIEQFILDQPEIKL